MTTSIAVDRARHIIGDHFPTLARYRVAVWVSRCGCDSRRVNPRFARNSQAGG